MSYRNLHATRLQRLFSLTLAIAVFSLTASLQAAGTAAKTTLTGAYAGTAKNRAQEVITLTLELTEKEGTVSGMIRSDHGNFSITGGSHHGDDVTLEFDADGTSGTITLKVSDDNLSGTWSAGDDGGAVEVKKIPAKEDAPKGNS